MIKSSSIELFISFSKPWFPSFKSLLEEMLFGHETVTEKMFEQPLVHFFYAGMTSWASSTDLNIWAGWYKRGFLGY